MQNAESDADLSDYNKSEEGVIPLVIACLSTAKFLEAIEETLYHIPPLICLFIKRPRLLCVRFRRDRIAGGLVMQIGSDLFCAIGFISKNILLKALIEPYLSAAKEHGILAPMYLELTTGLRRGELLALRWGDLDVQNRTLSINKSLARQDGKLVISTPKTPNSIRTGLLPEDTVKLLVEEHARHPANPYLFPSPRTGETWDPDGFRRLHDRIIKEIGAEHVRFHDMRHTFATLSLKSGVDVRTLSETLGHFSAGFTLSTYVHSTSGMKQSAADAIGNTIRNAI